MAVTAHSTHLRGILCGVVCGLVWFTADSSSGQSQDEAAAETAAVAALVHEAVDVIHTVAYNSEPKPVILTKALHGLVSALGDSARSYDKDLTAMPEGNAEQAFLHTLDDLAALPGQRLSLRNLAEASLQEYCKQHDAYTRYTPAADYKKFKLMDRSTGSGIGMTIYEKEGAPICFPMPGTPAEVAGIKPGDKLLSVEGKSVEGKSLQYLAEVIRGAPGTELNLRVEHGYGRAESLKIIREALMMPPVAVEKRMAGLTLRIRKFTDEAVELARKSLAGMSAGSTLTLDLRGCPGGHLESGVAFAAMFLEPGEPILTVRTRNKPDEVNVAQKPAEFKPATIVILQDGGTGSAAEVVIAALLASKNLRVASQGTKTFGKGVTQTPRELEGGGGMAITSGLLIGPSGESWNGVGLTPSLDKRRPGGTE